MQNYTNSDYALNKDSDNIVYDFADGKCELTLENFLAENPTMTEEDFRFWKDLSDEDYHKQWNEEYKQTYKDIPMNTVVEELESSDLSPDKIVVEAPEESRRKEKRAELGMEVLNILSEVQKRRYWLYHAKGLSTWKIAEIERVNQSKIMKSLQQADKKIRKYLKLCGY